MKRTTLLVRNRELTTPLTSCPVAKVSRDCNSLQAEFIRLLAEREDMQVENDHLGTELDRLRTSLNQTQARLQQLAVEFGKLSRSCYCSLVEQRDCKTSHWVELETIRTISLLADL